MLSLSIQSDCSGEQSRKSSWTTQCSSQLLQEILLHNPLKDASWSSHNMLCSFWKIVPEALIAIKLLLLVHIPLFCEDCPLGLTAAVQENVSEETSAFIYKMISAAYPLLCKSFALFWAGTRTFAQNMPNRASQELCTVRIILPCFWKWKNAAQPFLAASDELL